MSGADVIVISDASVQFANADKGGHPAYDAQGAKVGRWAWDVFLVTTP